MPGRFDSRELGEEPREYFLGYAGALRGLLKIGGLELFLAAVECQGQSAGLTRAVATRS